ncbi:MAG TPA: TonB family protein, partial [Terriglobales bacterium]|nr:TonB family protein [Terriglobales bacterium]
MFEDSLIESSKRFKTNRGKATAASFIIQAVIVCFLVLIPLIFVEALPTHQLMTELVAPPPPPPPPPPAAATAAARPRPVVKEQLNPNELHTPTKIPKQIVKTQEMASAAPPSNAAPPMGGVVGGVPGGVAGGQVGGVLGGVLNSPVAVPKVELKRVRVSQGVSQGLLTHKVEPQYPPLAKQAHIQGTVVLHAVIGKDGSVQGLQVVSGHPMLTASAISAVKQWKYKPYMLNGQPVEIDTTITVNFTL